MADSFVTTALGTKFDTEEVATEHRQKVALTPCTAGGCAVYHKVLTADNNAAVPKSAPGQIYRIWGMNLSASGAPFFVKLYDQTATPSNPASLTPKCVFAFGADSPRMYQLDEGLEFATGIAVVAVLGKADNDNTPIAVAGDGFFDMAYE